MSNVVCLLSHVSSLISHILCLNVNWHIFHVWCPMLLSHASCVMSLVYCLVYNVPYLLSNLFCAMSHATLHTGWGTVRPPVGQVKASTLQHECQQSGVRLNHFFFNDINVSAIFRHRRYTFIIESFRTIFVYPDQECWGPWPVPSPRLPVGQAPPPGGRWSRVRPVMAGKNLILLTS